MRKNSVRARIASTLAIYLLACLFGQIAYGQTLDRRLIGSFPREGGPITISTTDRPVVTRGLSFITETGSITLGDSPAPYETSRQTPNGVYTELGFNKVTLSGSVTLDAIATPDAVIEARYSQPLTFGTQSIAFPFLGGEAARFGIQGSYAYDGGPVTIEPVALPVNVRKLELNATAGAISSGGNAAPFASLDINTSTKWTASSQADVLIDGPVILDAIFQPGDPLLPSQLRGTAYDATGSGAFELTRQQPKSTDRIRGSYSWQGPVVVESTNGPVTLRGLDFFGPRHASAGIRGGSNPAPFQTATANRDDLWSIRSDVDVMLDGHLRLDATVAEGSHVDGQMWDGNISSSFEMNRRRELDATASIPFDGGNVSLSRTSINSVNVRLIQGQLQGGSNPAPFDSITNNTPIQWTVESNSIVEQAGPITLDVNASKGSKGSVIVSDGLDTATINLTIADPLPNRKLIGGYSLTEGGPVSLASNGPTTLRTLKIDALPNRGTLVAGGSAAPFDSLTANTDTTWSVESETDVTIDGIVQLDLEVEPHAFLAGQAFDGTTTTKVHFNGSSYTYNWHHSRLVAAYPEDGGNMLLLAPDEARSMAGIEFVAAPGILTKGEDPSPFLFFLSSATHPGAVTFAAIAPVTIDGVVELNVYVGPNTPQGTINGSSASPQPNVGLSVTAFPVLMMPSLEKFAAPTMTCIIPEDELVGDLDDNGTVEFRDFLVLAGNFRLEVNTYGEGDINCNGTVDFEDLLRLGNRFGETRPSATQHVPEPHALGLLAIGLLGIATLRRRR